MAAAEPEVLLQAEIWIFPLRFGRHIGFSTFGLVVPYSKCFHSIAGPRKWGASRRYLVAISSVSWGITISTSAAAILDFSLPVWSYSILSVLILFPLDCWTSKIGGSHRNYVAIRSASWDINTSASAPPPSWIFHFRFGLQYSKCFH